MEFGRFFISSAGTAFFVASALLLSGCSSAAAPRETYGAAEMAVRQAEKEDYSSQFAPAELKLARDKLALAQTAMAKRRYLEARRYSEQAIVDAELAEAKTDFNKSTLGASEERDAARDVRREIERNR